MRLLFLLFAILPFAVDFGQGLPYEPIKILLIEAGAIVGGATLLIAVFFGQVAATVGKNRRSPNVLDYSVAAWLAVLAASTAFSVDPSASFWGSAERGTGFLYYWCLAAVYLVVRLAAGPREWRLFIRLTSVVAAIVSAYGICQWLGIDASMLKGAFRLYGRSGPTRAFSTLGHPNFLGVYLALWLPFAWYMWRSEARRLWRLLALASALLAVSALALTYSRGAWLGAAGGLVAILAYRLKESGKFGWRNLVPVAAVGVVALGLLIWLAPRLKESPNSFIYRIGTSFDFSQGSTLARTAEWSYAVKLLPARPVFGYGLDTYIRYAGERIKDPAERNRDFQSADPSLADRLHNIVLDILWSAGLAGLAAFGAVIVTAFGRIRKLFIQNNESRHWLVALCSWLVVYLVCGLTGFDFSLSGLWLFLALSGISATEDVRTPATE